MASGITSTARPTGLRLAGTVCVALGAIAAGVGATREWATIGFPADTAHTLDQSVPGVDVWEGKVVLFAAVVSLLLLLAMRISGAGDHTHRPWGVVHRASDQGRRTGKRSLRRRGEQRPIRSLPVRQAGFA